VIAFLLTSLFYSFSLELYEEPSDDSGSAVVVRPLDKKKIIRCPSSERGEYIDARVFIYLFI